MGLGAHTHTHNTLWPPSHEVGLGAHTHLLPLGIVWHFKPLMEVLGHEVLSNVIFTEDLHVLSTLFYHYFSEYNL